ncbi:MAG: hypothetical protein CMH80_00375 [Nitrospinae bacterium]|nr:hypothetical protein [Nitrospinota bacterium]
MIDGVILVWFILTFASLLFVAVDIRNTPESPVLKWGFILLVAYTGPVGLLLYVIGCREPLKGLHERYVAVLWRQVLGSTMHCVSGDGVGILAGAVIGAYLHLSSGLHITLEYVLGFGFGWLIFQALFMRDSQGGSYRRALSNTFLPELVSMNALMAGMVPLMSFMMASIPGAHNPLAARFWFTMSMALLLGFILAYPINWWLVSRNLKHGMMTVRPNGSPPVAHDSRDHGTIDPQTMGDTHDSHAGADGKTATGTEVAIVTIISFVMLGVGLIVTLVL